MLFNLMFKSLVHFLWKNHSFIMSDYQHFSLKKVKVGLFLCFFNWALCHEGVLGNKIIWINCMLCICSMALYNWNLIYHHFCTPHVPPPGKKKKKNCYSDFTYDLRKCHELWHCQLSVVWGVLWVVMLPSSGKWLSLL